ncbi:hypothetical protein SALBM311S_01512 [Streptomyces alboniger]
MATASRGEIPKNSGSNMSMSSTYPPQRNEADTSSGPSARRAGRTVSTASLPSTSNRQ